MRANEVSQLIEPARKCLSSMIQEIEVGREETRYGMYRRDCFSFGGKIRHYKAFTKYGEGKSSPMLEGMSRKRANTVLPLPDREA